MVEVNAFAAPFNEANVYNETFLPGAFDEWLEKFKKSGKTLEMRVMHEPIIGHWDKVWAETDGLHAHGFITEDVRAGRDLATSKPIESLVEEGELTEISVDFSDVALTEAAREDNIKAFLLWMEISRKGRYRGKKNGTPVFAPQLVDRASLNEISLVNKGAFSGTHFTWQRSKNGLYKRAA